MKFKPELHTKEYLLSDLRLLRTLSEESGDFAKSELAADFDILSARYGDKYECIGHSLAAHRCEWLDNPANPSQCIKTLSLRDKNENAVAHSLAKNQTLWAMTPAAKNIEVLKLCNDDTDTVGYFLAKYHYQWISRLSVNDMEILTLPIQGDSDDPDDLTESVAEYIISKEPTALASELLNSMEFVKLPAYMGGYLAHKLALKHKTWINEPITKNIDVLKLSTISGWAVAHVLASNQPRWAQSNEASMDEVLHISDHHGDTVGHVLAKSQKDQCPRKIWAPEYLRLVRKDSSLMNYAIAHELAAQSRAWVNEAPEAFAKEFLTMTFTVNSQNANYVKVVSLAEILIGLSASEASMRMINVGAAFRFSSPQYVEKAIATNLSNAGFDLIENEADPLIRIKFSAALYSSLVNLYNSTCAHSLYNKADSNIWLAEIKKAEENLRKKALSFPELKSHLSIIKDVNCEPSDELLNKLINEIEFNAVHSTSGCCAEPAEEMKLY